MTKRKQSANGSNVYGDNNISRDINRGIKKANINVTFLNNCWREELKKDPDLPKRTTFLQWKRKFLKNYYVKRR